MLVNELLLASISSLETLLRISYPPLTKIPLATLVSIVHLNIIVVHLNNTISFRY